MISDKISEHFLSGGGLGKSLEPFSQGSDAQ